MYIYTHIYGQIALQKVYISAPVFITSITALGFGDLKKTIFANLGGKYCRAFD